jgi:hypothetical protein
MDTLHTRKGTLNCAAHEGTLNHPTHIQQQKVTSGHKTNILLDGFWSASHQITVYNVTGTRLPATSLGEISNVRLFHVRNSRSENVTRWTQNCFRGIRTQTYGEVTSGISRNVSLPQHFGQIPSRSCGWNRKRQRAFFNGHNKSPGSAVGIATRYGLGDRGVGVRVPVEPRIFTSLYRPDRLWGPPPPPIQWIPWQRDNFTYFYLQFLHSAYLLNKSSRIFICFCN